MPPAGCKPDSDDNDQRRLTQERSATSALPASSSASPT
jgi:hypothetical protein